MMWKILLFIASSCLGISGEEILILIPFGSRSHKNLFSPLAEGLGSRGHNVTVVTSFPDLKLHPNVTEIVFPEHDQFFQQTRKIFSKSGNSFSFSDMNEFLKVIESSCEYFFKKDLIPGWLQSKRKFDVVIIDAVMNECILQVAEHLSEQLIYLNTATLFPWIAESMDVPNTYSSVPSSMLPFSAVMNFNERFLNVLSSIFYDLIRHWIAIPFIERVVRKHFKDVRSYRAVERDVDFVLVNADPVLGLARPYMPNIADIGGIHCRDARPLPKDFDEFVSANPDGFVIFSLGSIHDDSVIPATTHDVFVSAFKQIKQSVLWKTDEIIPNVSENVRIVKWLPQQDLLGHPNVCAFITHSGLLSLQEAVYHGVPMVSIPIFADQPGNVAMATDLGITTALSLNNITTEELVAAIQKACSDRQMKIAVKNQSRIFRDREQSPLKTAIYWTEYVMRHKGAKHLRIKTDLNFFQYFLLDVIAVILLGFFSLILILIILFHFLKNFLTIKAANQKLKQTKKIK